MSASDKPDRNRGLSCSGSPRTVPSGENLQPHFTELFYQNSEIHISGSMYANTAPATTRPFVSIEQFVSSAISEYIGLQIVGLALCSTPQGTPCCAVLPNVE